LLSPKEIIAGSGAPDTHLVLNGRNLIIVTSAERAIFIHKVFRAQKDGYTFRACRVAFDSGEHRVDNISNRSLSAARDKDFGALEFEGTVGLTL